MEYRHTNEFLSESGLGLRDALIILESELYTRFWANNIHITEQTYDKVIELLDEGVDKILDEAMDLIEAEGKEIGEIQE